VINSPVSNEQDQQQPYQIFFRSSGTGPQTLP